MRTRSIYRRGGKRCLDVVVACAVLPVAAVPAAAIALLILLESGPPALFGQVRVGRGGRLFRLLKFRSMRVEAPGKAGSTITVAGDSRVTRVGSILRRWKLDELPQLVNVISGDMSLVGPRPDVPGYADRLEGRDRVILEMRPGITGPATLKYRDEERILAGVPDPARYNDEVIYPDKVRINREYAASMSLSGDLAILWRTLRGR